MISATCADNWASIIAIACSSVLSIVIDRSPRVTRARASALSLNHRHRPNPSKCGAACARQPPPFGATESAQPAGDFALARREDGGLQWTHRGRPLYTFSGDAAPGDVTGLGAGPD